MAHDPHFMDSVCKCNSSCISILLDMLTMIPKLGLWELFLTRSALSWFAPLLEKNSLLRCDWEAFLEKFLGAFGDSNRECVVETKMQNLQQGTRSTFIYATEFRQLIVTSIRTARQLLTAYNIIRSTWTSAILDLPWFEFYIPHIHRKLRYIHTKSKYQGLNQFFSHETKTF